jgi:hypothetical protein
MGRVYSTHGRKEKFILLVRKSEGRRPLGRPKHRWEDNIKMGLRETECDGVNWINLAQDREMSGGLL